MVGQQYKKNYLEYDFTPDVEISWIQAGDNTDSGIEISHKEVYLENLWQSAIVKNANTIMPGVIGNFPGDDEAKIRGIKYVVTGDCNSDMIEVQNLGAYDMKESLLSLYKDEISAAFKSKNYIIGNAVLKPRNICHSFVLMDMRENMIKTYDPWNESIVIYDICDVFENGFESEKGVGIIRWIQFIKGNV